MHFFWMDWKNFLPPVAQARIFVFNLNLPFFDLNRDFKRFFLIFFSAAEICYSNLTPSKKKIFSHLLFVHIIEKFNLKKNELTIF